MTSHAPAAPFVSAGTADRIISRPLIPRARGTRRAQWNIAATAVIWATSLFVAALWVAGGGVQSLLVGGGETLTTLGRITGLVSVNLLLYQVLLMARVPLFERGFGRDAITRMHRWVGFWSFWLLLAHIVLLVLGYAVTAGVNPLTRQAEAWSVSVRAADSSSSGVSSTAPGGRAGTRSRSRPTRRAVNWSSRPRWSATARSGWHRCDLAHGCSSRDRSAI